MKTFSQTGHQCCQSLNTITMYLMSGGLDPCQVLCQLQFGLRAPEADK